MLRDCEGVPEVVLIATGSEVELVVQAARALGEKGRRVRVVSMPSTNVFDVQDEAYRESVLPAAVSARVAVEAGVTGGWYKYVGCGGRIVGIDRFGESAPAADVFEYLGFTVDHVVETVEQVV